MRDFRREVLRVGSVDRGRALYIVDNEPRTNSFTLVAEIVAEDGNGKIVFFVYILSILVKKGSKFIF